MDINPLESCLYDCDVMHQRMSPKPYGFKNKTFMFYIHLDELSVLSKKLPLLSLNRFNIYTFNEADHLPNVSGRSLKEKVITYLSQNGYNAKNYTVMLLSNLRVLGYVFNPVSFYFCFDENKQPVCCIAEVSNTFHESKPFIIPPDQNGLFDFRSTETKFFYVSPYSELTYQFDFRCNYPDETLSVFINTLPEKNANQTHNNSPVIASSLRGKRKPLTSKHLLWMSVKHPFMPQQVISQIHWHAFILWLKRLPFQLKEANQSLQRGILNPLKKSHNKAM